MTNRSFESVHTTKAYSDLPLGRMFTDEEHIFPGRLDLIRMFKRYADFHSLVGTFLLEQLFSGTDKSDYRISGALPRLEVHPMIRTPTSGP